MTGSPKLAVPVPGCRMNRRVFLATLAGCAAAWPFSVSAQPTSLPLIGFLSTRTARESEGLVAGFHRGLREAGFTEGRNVSVEYRWADGQIDRLPALAAEIVALRPAVIAAVGGPRSSFAARDATKTIPIVFTMGDDPVKLGLVASLSRPGGNITGVTALGGTLSAKRFQLLRELVPHAKLIAVLVNPNRPDIQSQTAELQKAAREVGQQVAFLNASTPSEIDGAFAAAAQKGAGALLISNDPFLNIQRELLAAAGVRRKMSTMAAYRENAEAGALVSYGIDQTASYQQVGRLCRPDSQRREACRPASRAACALRARDQSEDGEGSGDLSPAGTRDQR